MGRNKLSYQKKVMEKFEKNNSTIALNVLYAKKKNYILLMFQKIVEIVKKVIVLMIPNAKGQHYLVAKEQSAFLRGITSKHHGDFYCLNCLLSFAIENKCESHKDVK